MNRLLLCLMSTLVSTSLFVFPCSCDTIPFEEATERADEIFFGRLIRLREVQTYELDGEKKTQIWGALFEVEKKWKGSSDKYVEVFQANTSCDFYFDFPNRPYIIYAQNSELFFLDKTQSFIELETWLCARNAGYRTYYNYEGDGFDDRERLDEKYPTTVKLSKFYFKWKWIGIGGILLLIGMLIGRVTKTVK